MYSSGAELKFLSWVGMQRASLITVRCAPHAGNWGHASPGKFLKIDAKILQFRGIFT